MSKKNLFALWGGLFVLCAGLGMIPEPRGGLKALMTVLSLVFFLPPALLLRQRDRQTLKILRNFAIASLGLTVLGLMANFMSLMAPEAVGNVLYGMLVIVSTPMVCSGYWLLSLFCWALLLMAALRELGSRK